MTRGRRAWAPLALAAFLAVLGVAACGDDDEPVGASGTTAPGSSTSDGAPSAPLADVPTTEVTVRRGGEAARGCAFLAADAATRARGLMGVTDLGDRIGMVFDLGRTTTAAFWMKDTPMPLSIAFFDDDGAHVSSTDMAPCVDGGDCPTYGAEAPYRYALEVPMGDLGALGVDDGAELVLGAPC